MGEEEISRSTSRFDVEIRYMEEEPDRSEGIKWVQIRVQVKYSAVGGDVLIVDGQLPRYSKEHISEPYAASP